VHHVEGIEQGRGYRHTAENRGAALFEAFGHQHAGGEINPVMAHEAMEVVTTGP
jgi:hypothetical protein